MARNIEVNVEKGGDPLAVDSLDIGVNGSLVEQLSERQPMVVDDDDMDPLEWMVRKVIPIPKVYYWDVVKEESEQQQLPLKLRAWHSSISGFSKVGSWLDRRVAQPIAKTFGLTDSRFDFVTDHMTEEDLAASRREVMRRKQVANDREQTTEQESSM